MPGQLLGAASSAFNSALSGQNEISKDAIAERKNNADRSAKLMSDFGTAAIQQYGANKRQVVSEEAATERQQSEIESQFITLTQNLKNGAKELTGDNSWDKIPDGYKMRADIYSALLGAGSKMTELMQPRTFEIQEGNQIYTAEYDPKTKTLRKLTKGSDKFSPDQKNGTSNGGKLNPFTLQNLVRQDEKTLLAQLGGKGKKGIPSAGPIDKILSKISNGKIQELSAEEQSKLATLKSLATRMRNNYQNLNTIEIERGLQPTVIDPDVMSTIDSILSTDNEQNAASGTKVKLKSVKTGKYYYFPKEKEMEALENGFTKQ